MQLNIQFSIVKQINKKHSRCFLSILIAGLLILSFHSFNLAAQLPTAEPIRACVLYSEQTLNPLLRSKIAKCLGWYSDSITACSACRGTYYPVTVCPFSDTSAVRLQAKDVSLSRDGRSVLKGGVNVLQHQRMISAETAYVYRNAKTGEIAKIELFDGVHYLEPGRLMIAKKATIDPRDKSAIIENVLYRFNTRRTDLLPAWGRANLIQRFANKDYLLNKASYSTCAPEDTAWNVEADSIYLDQSSHIGIARHAKLRVGGVPILYSPYLSFPTSKARKSGFLLPTVGFTTIGDFNYAQPYYWNIAPNYDATITPHYYSKRGFQLGGQFRYLTEYTTGVFNARYLPQDRAFRHFLWDNQLQYPSLAGLSTDRWAAQIINSTQLGPHWHLGINYQQVSDDYYLQDFSTNFAVLTERQLLRQGDLSFTTDHWLFRGMVQSYQTLQPINETPIEGVYRILPQLMARGTYDELFFNGSFNFLSQWDNFKWPQDRSLRPDGSRFHLDPYLSFPQLAPWGFFTPTVDIIHNNYTITNNVGFFLNDTDPANNNGYLVNRWGYFSRDYYQRTIPRYSLDTGLYFDRNYLWFNQLFTQTLEPRFYYLYVPYYNQTPIPVFDTGYMIFNFDQLFRRNRFSGFDRIGDANQLSYALTSRWLSNLNGMETASISIGQARYFSKRRVQLCQNSLGECVDNPLTLGYLPQDADYSPIVTHGLYRFNQSWLATGGYVWDPGTNATYNGYLNLHFMPSNNKIININYSYLVNGDVTQVAYSNVQNNPLHQIGFGYAWPLNENWSTLGAYTYNISKRYEMMSFLGLQYESCCWAIRFMGGRSFQSLNSNATPEYTDSFFLQVVLKGLGAIGNSDPTSTIQAFVPGYRDIFHTRV